MLGRFARCLNLPQGGLRYHLMNAVESTTIQDPEMYVGRRKDLYAQMYRIFHESRRSPIKPANLWVLLYSQFCTVRNMVEPHSAINNTLDEDMKRAFRSMIDNLADDAVPSDVNQQVVQVILANQPGLSTTTASAYQRMVKFSVGQPEFESKLDNKQLDMRFMVSTRPTDLYLCCKLQEDIDKLGTWPQKYLRQLGYKH